MLHTSDFDFELPTELIASHPLEKRDASRMLVVLGSPPLEGCPQGGVVRDTVNYRTLPFNLKLKQRARELRKAGSLPEALLWNEIKNKKINGLNFNRQTVIGNYIVDFFCPKTGLVIEIDDKATHDFKGLYDERREKFLVSLGLTTLHVSAQDVLQDAGSVAEMIKRHPGTSCHPSSQRGTCFGFQMKCDEYKNIDMLKHNSQYNDTENSPLARGVAGSTRRGVALFDKHIRDFLDYLRPGDVVVFNNSRVIPARFDADDHEITLHTAVNDHDWWGLCKKFNKIQIGDTLTMVDGTTITVLDKDDESGLLLRFNCDNVFDVLGCVGKMPLPPYMKREAEISDSTRYQTVYADPLGSMAAPTAGLHFTDELMAEIEARGAKIVKITLHVGAGTWMPVKTENLAEHKMHSEWCQITPEQADIINSATRVIAVGTTSLRTLESAAAADPTPAAGSVPLLGVEAVARAGVNSVPLLGGVAGSTRRGGGKKDICMNLPTNPKLKSRARELRKAGSLPEALLWKEIKGKKINGLDFDRQHVIGNYIVDFFCSSIGFIIEIDDKTHDTKVFYDEKRDKYLQGLGLTVMHISASDVLQNPSVVAKWIENVIVNTPTPVGSTHHPSAGGERRVRPFCGTTDIFITPGYRFRVVDVLLTNFHLPKSTLFMLVSAFSGLDEMKSAYAHAIAEKYRFFSYGDCCLLFRKEPDNEI